MLSAPAVPLKFPFFLLMAIRALCFPTRGRVSTFLFQSLLHPPSSHFPLPPHGFPFSSLVPPEADLVNDICRVLSDHRELHHDLELALTPYSSKVSASLVEQVLKRTRNLGFAAHRFFLWASRFPSFRPSVDNYKILIGILGSSKQFALIWDLLSQMKQSENLHLCPDLFWFIFGLYVRANSPGDAIRAFNKMADFGLRPTLDDLDRLLYMLCKRKFVANAQDFFDTVKFGFSSCAKTYSILIRGWGDIGDANRAKKVFDEMLERVCLVDLPAYNSLLEALCKGGNVSEAYESFREMRTKGVEPDAGTYSIFIRAYCEGNNVYSAFRVLDRMRRYDLVPNSYTYNCLIKRLCKNEKIEGAYELLDEMASRGVQPDIWSYSSLLLFHCSRYEVNRACKLVSRMEKENCMPNQHTYNMLLKTLIKVGRFDRVSEVWNSMERRGFFPPVSTYAVMIHGFLKKNGKLEEACRYFEVMVDEGIPPYTTTCELLRNRLVGLGLMGQVDVLAAKMERSSSCSIQELSKIMRGKRSNRKSRREDYSGESEEEWVSGWDK